MLTYSCLPATQLRTDPLAEARLPVGPPSEVYRGGAWHLTDDEITYVSERSLELIELHGGALSSHMGPGVSEYTLTYTVPFFLLAAALNGAIPDHETLDRLIDVGSGRVMCQVLEYPEASREEFEELYQAISKYLAATTGWRATTAMTHSSFKGPSATTRLPITRTELTFSIFQARVCCLPTSRSPLPAPAL